MNPVELTVIEVPGPNHRVGRAETIPRWSTTSRLALGCWTFAMPAIAMVLAARSVLGPPELPPSLLAAVCAFLVGHGLIALFYAAFAGQNPRLRSRFAWQLAIVLAGPVAIPVYWVIHVWFAPYVGPVDRDDEVPGFDMYEARLLHASH